MPFCDHTARHCATRAVPRLEMLSEDIGRRSRQSGCRELQSYAQTAIYPGHSMIEFVATHGDKGAEHERT